MTKNLNLTASLCGLTDSQRAWVDSVIAQFALRTDYKANSASDLITPQVLARMGDALQIHHAFSHQALSKDRFEFAFQRCLTLAGHSAQLAESRTNPGHDLTVDGVRFSLKTEAAKNIKVNTLHISKFMELGKGVWDLETQRQAYLAHLNNYDRVLQFRRLKSGPVNYRYELVEIPKALLLEAANVQLEVRESSRQNPKPGYGRVFDGETGAEKFALYFDGGTERKLQIKNVRKDLCTVHATWDFDSTPLA